MIKWKLCRQQFGNEVYDICEGNEITVGRGLNNNVTLSSIVVSRNHCVIKVEEDEVTVKDLKSSNGVYVGLKKIPPNIPYSVSENDIIGVGWTFGASLATINDTEKFVFKLVKQENIVPYKNRFQYQSEEDTNDCKISLKRKLSLVQNNLVSVNIETAVDISAKNNNVVCLLSDSDGDFKKQNNSTETKKRKLDHIKEEPIGHDLKFENDDLQYEAFSIKQEYLGNNDEAIQVDSDSDSESEHWLLRLSQSSPGKPFVKVTAKQKETCPEETSYSQWDDDVQIVTEEEIYLDDLISIPTVPPDVVTDSNKNLQELQNHNTTISVNELSLPPREENRDKVDGILVEPCKESAHSDLYQNEISVRKLQVIEPLSHPTKRKSHLTENKSKSKSNKECKSRSRKSSSKLNISHTRKEERKQKLKEIACKDKDLADSLKSSSNSNNKLVVNVKITNSNRGAFLTNLVHENIKPTKRNEIPQSKKKDIESPIANTEHDHSAIIVNDQRKSLQNVKVTKLKENNKSKRRSSRSKTEITKEPIKVIKLLTECEKPYSGKPVSKVVPLPPKKTKKKVHFCSLPPEVHLFDIEPGNQMMKTNSIKTTLVDIRKMPMFSLEKITLIKVLRWNPHWLTEQISNPEPPPLLGHNNPIAILHSFNSHKQYIQLVGDLLLMEIWECLTQSYIRSNKQQKTFEMRIEHLPPMPPNERCFDLFNLSVNISMPTSEGKTAPRMGEVLMVEFGPPEARICRFFFVHNVRILPAPPNNKNTFFSIALYTTFTDKMKILKPGQLLIGKTLAYIQNELQLYEAMEYLSGSPLCEAILKPEPKHFESNENNLSINMKSQWTNTLNDSQKKAVISSVSAALDDQPCIQMVQGPPGTGKSSVICAMVMTYFYDAVGKIHQNRGKILICATSNAAVDDLVIRLLNIRQSLPKAERFRMVRVGRAEAMHGRAREVSSQTLAHRDAARLLPDANNQVLLEEILHLEAKMNMWMTLLHEAKDPVRVAYCQGRISLIADRIRLLRNGSSGGDEIRPERLVGVEKRIIERADIIVTTLASAQNNKMKGLKGRIALCIVDEAGQAIEPETLVPLTLDVTKLTLIGDPQQLPGFICSQRAKKHGLGESLFARLTSFTEHWSKSPVILLNQQYRMHADIADYPNRAFYDGQIITAPRKPIDLPIPPYIIMAISSGDKGQGSSGANEVEACGVCRIAAALSSVTSQRGLSLALITPYAAHRDLVKKYLKNMLDTSSIPIEVNTVDSFQGQERDVVIVSLARSHGLGFLSDAGRMNVMLTRAKLALIVCLNPLAVTRNGQWRTLVEDAQSRGVYRTLPNKMCRATSAGRDDEQILKYING